MGAILNLGQFRKTSLRTDKYLNTINDYRQENEKIQSFVVIGELTVSVFYIDKKLVLSTPLQTENNYYLDFKIGKNEEFDQEISIFLKNSTLGKKGHIQKLKTITIPKGNFGSQENFEIIFSPLENFDEIIFQLKRIPEDMNIKNQDGSYGRQISLIINSFSSLENLLKHMEGTIGKTTNLGFPILTKFGIQGRPGLLMCINGEPIRIGKSGIYENNYNIATDFIGIVIKDQDSSIDSDDYFIIDYQY